MENAASSKECRLCKSARSTKKMKDDDSSDDNMPLDQRYWRELNRAASQRPASPRRASSSLPASVPAGELGKKYPLAKIPVARIISITPAPTPTKKRR